MRWAVLAAVLLASPVAAQQPPVSALPERVTGAFAFNGALTQGAVVRGMAPAGATAVTLDGAPVPIAPDGAFLIAFDRDASPNATITALKDGEAIASQTLIVAPRAWRIERLSTLARFSAPTAEFTALRAPELARIAAARDVQTDAAGWRQRFVWPAIGRISGLFGAQRMYRGEPGAYHSGVDVAKGEGAEVRAPADGVVILAADHQYTLEGNLLMIDHGMRLNSAFLHLSRIAVAEGAHVRQGDVIGYVGRTGRATGPHLHWGMKWGERRVDPMLIAGAMPGVGAP